MPQPEKHFGIWVGKTKGWMRFDSNNIFWTTSYAVAKAQLLISVFSKEDDACIRCFEDWNEWYGRFNGNANNATQPTD